jgi:RNA polymerase sigma-70 factor, ECF subfamily
MRWSLKPTRHAADLPPDGEAVLRPIPGLGGVELAGAGIGRRSVGPRPAWTGINIGISSISAFSGTRPGPSAGPRADGDGKENADPENGQESAERAQPSGPDGVREDMATLVLDNSAMGAGTSSRPGSPEAGMNAALDPHSDAAIMLRVATGDEAGFNYLAQKYHRAIIHFLFRMVRNEAVAEELAQEVFLRVYRSRESYRAEAKFTTWLYRIATNLAVNHARDTKHERSAQTIYLDAPDEESGTTPDVADDEPSVEQRLLRDERMAAIRTHVMALPERQRMAVLMHKYQGMDYRQIGDVLKLSESATKSLLFRAYQTLRDKLKEFV